MCGQGLNRMLLGQTKSRKGLFIFECYLLETLHASSVALLLERGSWRFPAPRGSGCQHFE